MMNGRNFRNAGAGTEPTQGGNKPTTFKNFAGGSSGAIDSGSSGGNRRTDTTLAQSGSAKGVRIKGHGNPTKA